MPNNTDKFAEVTSPFAPESFACNEADVHISFPLSMN